MVIIDVIWHYQGTDHLVKQFKHEELAMAVSRAISFSKLSARANAVGSPELFGHYTVEDTRTHPRCVYYTSETDEAILKLRATHNRSKEPHGKDFLDA